MADNAWGSISITNGQNTGQIFAHTIGALFGHSNQVSHTTKVFHCIALDSNEFVKRLLISKSFWSYKIFGLAWHNISGSTWDTKSYAFVLYCPLYIHVCCSNELMEFSQQLWRLNFSKCMWIDQILSIHFIHWMHLCLQIADEPFVPPERAVCKGGATWELARCIGQPPNSSPVYSDQLFSKASPTCPAKLWNEWYHLKTV